MVTFYLTKTENRTKKYIPNPNTFFTSSTLPDKVRYVIQDLKTNKSTGPNG